MKIRALLAQINPHFIFNSLYSIQQFIISNEQDLAIEYLNKFARLMRMILEHSEQELRQKLKSREYEADAIDQVIQELIRDHLQSDERFTEAYVNHRFNAGVGPLKIRYELRPKGITDLLAEEFLESQSDRWNQLMMQQRARKFGDAIPADYAERMKQARFLQNKGFSPESVMRLFH